MMRRLLILSILFSFLIAQDYNSEIQPIWDNSCTASCHNSGNVSGGLNLTSQTSYNELVNVASQGYSGFQRVKPNDVANSVLFQKIVGNSSFGDRMPKGGGNLAQADEEKIKKWIENGAPQSGGGGSDYAFDFGPNQAQINVDPPIEGEQNWSIESWVNFHQKASSGTFYDLFQFAHQDNNENLMFFEFNGTENKFWLFYKGATGTSQFQDDNMFDNKWHHIFVSGDGSKIKLFVDGTEKLELDYSGSFHTSDKKMIFGVNMDGSIDEVRMRKKSDFPGVPTASYGAEEGTLLTWDFNDGHSTQATDESGHSNHGEINGTAAYESGVYSGTGGGNNGIDVTIAAQNELSGQVRIGFVPSGSDPNYWTSATFTWETNIDFPSGGGNQNEKIWDNGINDSNDNHLIAFLDANNDNQWDDATEYGGISQPFGITNKQGNAGTIDLKRGGGGGGFSITVEVELQEEYPAGQVWFGVWEMGQDPATTQPIFEETIGEDPPFIRSYGFNWTLQDGKSYFIGGFFDMNNNNMPDQSEPQGRSIDFTWPVSGNVHLELEDMSGPDIDVGSISGTMGATEDQTLTLALDIHSSHGVQNAKIEYFIGGSTTMQSSGMSNSGGDTWEGSIPASDVTSQGLLYEIVAEDDRGMESSTGIDEIRVDFSELHLTNTPSEEYVMISAPGQLQNASMSAVLDELGEADPKVWRIFRWTGNGYAENSGSFTAGKAYWLITKDAETILAGTGKSTGLKNPPSISLSSGWNMIAIPFDFSVDMNDNSFTVEGDVEPNFYEYNGSAYTNASRLNPGEGVWVYANSSASIKFDFIGAIEGSGSEANDELDEFEQGGWKANFIASAGSKQDVVNVFGAHPNAENEWDKHDRREPPVIGDYVSVAFENQSWSSRGGRYSQDIRLEDDQVQSWTLAAKTNIRGIVHLELEDLNAIPAYQDIRLVDTALGIVYDLRSQKEVTFTSRGTGNPYYFQLMVGPADDIQNQLDDLGIVPNSFELAQNSPNPFNPVTNIGVSLIEDANITLRVYNLLGEEMNTLAFNRSFGKGNHRFIWGGKDDYGRQLPSGVYLYRLEVISHNGTQLFQDTKKMVLMK